MASSFHHHMSPSHRGEWSKTPYGYGNSTSMVPFTNPATGRDFSSALDDPMRFMSDMNRALAHPSDMSRTLAHPGDLDRTVHSMEHAMQRQMENMTRAMANPAAFDRNVRSMEHAMQRQMMHMQHDMERMMKRADPTYTTDLVHHPARPASIMEHYSLMNPIRTDPEGNRWLNCCFDLRSFKPEEINVVLNSKDRCINVEANHEVRDSKDHYIKRHYARKFFLPDNLKCDLTTLELKSCLNNEGLLCLEAALPKLTPEEASSMALATPSSFTVPIPVKHA